MKMFKSIAVMLVAALFLGGLQTAQAQTTYIAGATLVLDEAGDRGNDVEAETLDGIWSFGTKTSSTEGWAIMPSIWHVDSFGEAINTDPNAFAGWSEDNCAPGDCVPLIAVNTTLDDQTWVGLTEFAPAKFWVHPNQTGTAPGPCVAVRWTAPVDGTADVSAVWEGKYNGCGDGVTAHVTIGSELLPTFGWSDGAYPPLDTPITYTANDVPLLAGDYIDFSTCPNEVYNCDSTQFDAMVTLTPAAEQVSCMGFFEPFADPLSVKKKTKRNLPLKFRLYDEGGVELTDADIAAPLVQVILGEDQGSGIEGYDEASLPNGLADDGNEFYYDYDESQWTLVLGLKAYTGSGSYEISAVSGDPTSYEIVGCTETFTRLP